MRDVPTDYGHRQFKPHSLSAHRHCKRVTPMGGNVGPRTPSGTGADSDEHGWGRVAVARIASAEALQ